MPSYAGILWDPDSQPRCRSWGLRSVGVEVGWRGLEAPLVLEYSTVADLEHV
jgi:hypothetical protein